MIKILKYLDPSYPWYLCYRSLGKESFTFGKTIIIGIWLLASTHFISLIIYIPFDMVGNALLGAIFAFSYGILVILRGIFLAAEERKKGNLHFLKST